MTNWDDIAKNAANETDAELEKGLANLKGKNLAALMPAPADKTAIEKLMATIAAETRYNERLAAFKACAATLSSDGLKALRKAMLLLLACLALAAPAAAQDVTASGINLKQFLENTRVGVWLPAEGGRSFKTVYAPIIWLHGLDGTEYICLDAGAAAPGEVTSGYAVLALSFRVDNALNKALGISKWMKAHISSADLPSLELGLAPMLYQSKVRWGVLAAIKF
jgi:hypothetical protein